MAELVFMAARVADGGGHFKAEACRASGPKKGFASVPETGNSPSVVAKRVIALSLTVNVVLAVVLFLQFRQGDKPFSPAGSNSVTIVTNAQLRVAKTNILFSGRPFRWQDIESTNYELYVMNLRGIGCPPSTVKDIVVADVNQLFSRKRKELNTTTNDIQWWRSEPDPEELRANLQRIQELEQERSRLLTRLLGTNWDRTVDTQPDPVPLNGAVLGALTPEQKQTVQDIVARSREAARKHMSEREQQGEGADPVELASIREMTRSELEKVLNPVELEEFLLRFSQNASRLRDELRGFNATPDEFRRLYSATDAIDRELQLLPDDDPSFAARRQELEQQRQKAVWKTLSKDRYQEYQMATDPEYRQALADAQAAGTPAAGRALYLINQDSLLEKERILNDPNLTDEEKERLWKEAEQTQQAARAAALGLEPPPEAEPKPQAPQPYRHSAAPGDTLARLSLLYSIPIEELRRANPDLGFGPLQPGQAVKIPEMPKPLFIPAFVPSSRRAGEGIPVPPVVPSTPLR